MFFAYARLEKKGGKIEEREREEKSACNFIHLIFVYVMRALNDLVICAHLSYVMLCYVMCAYFVHLT